MMKIYSVFDPEFKPFGQDGDGFRVPAGEYRGQGHVRVLTNGALDPPAQVAVA